MKLRVRIATAVLILAVSSLSGVSVGCYGALCALVGDDAPGQCSDCLTKFESCGALIDPPCCDHLRCKRAPVSGVSRCMGGWD
jgi:hypothetical protein